MIALRTVTSISKTSSLCLQVSLRNWFRLTKRSISITWSSTRIMQSSSISRRSTQWIFSCLKYCLKLSTTSYATRETSSKTFRKVKCTRYPLHSCFCLSRWRHVSTSWLHWTPTSFKTSQKIFLWASKVKMMRSFENVLSDCWVRFAKRMSFPLRRKLSKWFMITSRLLHSCLLKFSAIRRPSRATPSLRTLTNYFIKVSEVQSIALQTCWLRRTPNIFRSTTRRSSKSCKKSLTIWWWRSTTTTSPRDSSLSSLLLWEHFSSAWIWVKMVALRPHTVQPHL